LISLLFTFSGVPVYARGAFFRICADSTLRGPDGGLVAAYSSRGWQLGPRYCREFDAIGPLFLRAHRSDGRADVMGPFEMIRASHGALFGHGRCLGTYCTNRAASPGVPEWSGITLLDRWS